MVQQTFERSIHMHLNQAGRPGGAASLIINKETNKIREDKEENDKSSLLKGIEVQRKCTH